jgi:hypothetical protein
MSDKKLFVERRPEGDYAVRKANSDRASAVLPTQAQAIEVPVLHPWSSAFEILQVANRISGARFDIARLPDQHSCHSSYWYLLTP